MNLLPIRPLSRIKISAPWRVGLRTEAGSGAGVMNHCDAGSGRFTGPLEGSMGTRTLPMLVFMTPLAGGCGGGKGAGIPVPPEFG